MSGTLRFFYERLRTYYVKFVPSLRFLVGSICCQASGTRPNLAGVFTPVLLDAGAPPTWGLVSGEADDERLTLRHAALLTYTSPAS